eukprot:Clim_evm15s156 gene=Clim_evmTU15s156
MSADDSVVKAVAEADALVNQLYGKNGPASPNPWDSRRLYKTGEEDLVQSLKTKVEPPKRSRSPSLSQPRSPDVAQADYEAYLDRLMESTTVSGVVRAATGIAVEDEPIFNGVAADADVADSAAVASATMLIFRDAEMGHEVTAVDYGICKGSRKLPYGVVVDVAVSNGNEMPTFRARIQDGPFELQSRLKNDIGTVVSLPVLDPQQIDDTYTHGTLRLCILFDPAQDTALSAKGGVCQAKVFIEMSTVIDPLSWYIVGTLPVAAEPARCRLQIPRSCHHLFMIKGTNEISAEREVPVRNAGNVTASLQVKVQGNGRSRFRVEKENIDIAPGETRPLKFYFVDKGIVTSQMVGKKITAVAVLSYEPDSKSSEIVLSGITLEEEVMMEVMSKNPELFDGQQSRSVKERLGHLEKASVRMLADQTYLDFSTVPLQTSHTLKITIRNESEGRASMVPKVETVEGLEKVQRLRTENYEISIDTADYGKNSALAVRGHSIIVLEVTLTAFRAAVVNAWLKLDLKRANDINTVLRIPIIAFCGQSNIIAPQLAAGPNGYYARADIPDDFTFTVENTGDRAAFIILDSRTAGFLVDDESGSRKGARTHTLEYSENKIILEAGDSKQIRIKREKVDYDAALPHEELLTLHYGDLSHLARLIQKSANLQFASETYMKFTRHLVSGLDPSRLTVPEHTIKDCSLDHILRDLKENVRKTNMTIRFPVDMPPSDVESEDECGSEINASLHHTVAALDSNHRDIGLPVLDIGEVEVGEVKKAEILVDNSAIDLPRMYSVKELAPAYLYDITSALRNPDLGNTVFRLKYDVYTMAWKDGCVRAAAKETIPISFRPLKEGIYVQTWDIIWQDRDGDIAKERFLIKAIGTTKLQWKEDVHTHGQTSGLFQVTDQRVPSPYLRNAPQSLLAGERQPAQVAPATHYHPSIKESTIDLEYGPTLVGNSRVLKVRMENPLNEEVTYTIGTPEPPFHIVHRSIVLGPQSFVKLPVGFHPRAAGSYASELVAVADGGLLRVNVQLSGLGRKEHLTIADHAPLRFDTGPREQAIRLVNLSNVTVPFNVMCVPDDEDLEFTQVGVLEANNEMELNVIWHGMSPALGGKVKEVYLRVTDGTITDSIRIVLPDPDK